MNPMVGLFKVDLINSSTFQIDFEIAENCNYKRDTSGSVDIIEVNLDPGETDPSTTFKWYSEQYNPVNNEFDLEFNQKFSSGTVKRPKIGASI